MSRSKWKGPFIKNSVLIKKNTLILIQRNTEILPQFIGFTFNIHNGKNFIVLTVKEQMIHHKFGEFSFTRSKVI